LSGTGPAFYEHAKGVIPGGTQLLSKRPEMFLPDNWPSYYSRAAGAEVWDLDGRRYVDMCYNGIGACVLGFADPEVNDAVKKAVDLGSMATLNCVDEVELAELLCELHPWASRVRFGRSGGEAMAMAVRIARASTGRDRVAFSGYHGWHDWYLAANLGDEDALNGHLLPGLDPTGVPRALRGTALPFHYNRLDELEAIVASHAGDLAAIVMEPMRGVEPAPGFLEGVRRIASQIGAALIFDEITSGFRLNTGGIHLLQGVEPDVAVFAKAMSNGFPMAAVIGRADVMEAAQTTFISSTYWTERIGPAAALATIRKHRRENVAAHLITMGRLVKEGWKKAAEEAGLNLHVGGMDPLAHFAIEHPKAPVLHTLFTQLMLDHGFLASKAFYATYAHSEAQVESYLDAVRDVYGELARLLKEGGAEGALRGPVAHSGFARLT
jgi:glutamate-1-semialdehyde 2,1-aminomutase